MAKRLECQYCAKQTSEVRRDVRNPETGETTTVVHVIPHQPKFRGKRQLARHLEQTHTQDKTAQKYARELLAEARNAVRANRKEQKHGKR